MCNKWLADSVEVGNVGNVQLAINQLVSVNALTEQH